jgi:hypothetical protein
MCTLTTSYDPLLGAGHHDDPSAGGPGPGQDAEPLKVQK